MKYRRARRPLRRFKVVKLRSKIKSERRRKMGRLFLGLAVICACIGGGWWVWNAAGNFLSRSDLFKISAIDVRGCKNVTRSELVAMLPVREGDSIFSFRRAHTENALRRCKPELKRLNVRRGWKKIVISIDERIPVACTFIGGKRMGIDNDNAPFPLRGQWVKAVLPEVSATDASERSEVLRFIREFAPAAKSLFPRVERFTMESLNDIVMELTDGSKIFWGPVEKNKIKAKLERLEQVFDDAGSRFSGLEYVNLCYFDSGRILVRPALKQVKQR